VAPRAGNRRQRQRTGLMSRAATARISGERDGKRRVNACIMRRSLVLSDESARHPFLASLPPHVRGRAAPMPSRPGWAITTDDVRGFVGAYFASLVAVAIFIA
jgi:hypothetical protein